VIQPKAYERPEEGAESMAKGPEVLSKSLSERAPANDDLIRRRSKRAEKPYICNKVLSLG